MECEIFLASPLFFPNSVGLRRGLEEADRLSGRDGGRVKVRVPTAWGRGVWPYDDGGPGEGEREETAADAVGSHRTSLISAAGAAVMELR